MSQPTRDRGVTAAPAHDNSEPRRAETAGGRLSFHTDPDRGPITAAYARALANCLIAERPDWNPHAIGAALDECRDQEPAKLRRAAFRVAETKGAGPDTIPLVGPHWEDEPKPQAPKPAANVVDFKPRMCPDHPRVPARDCTDCKGKHKRPPWFDDLYETEAEKDAQRRADLKAQEEAAARARAEAPNRI